MKPDCRTVARPPRPGVALVAVLICLSVVSAMLLSLARQTLLAQRQLTNWHRQEQAEWLVEAGVQHAARALARHTDYRGEMQTLVLADDMSTPVAGDGVGTDPANPPPADSLSAELTVSVGEPEATLRPVQVTVRYPIEATQPVQITRRVWIRNTGSDST